MNEVDKLPLQFDVSCQLDLKKIVLSQFAYSDAI
jgi:hypothetical protein